MKGKRIMRLIVPMLAPMLALLLAACTGSSGNCVRLSANGKYCLVEGDWPEFTTEQAATVSYNGTAMVLLTRIRSGKEGLHFAGVTPLGQTLVEVSLERNMLHTQLPPSLAGRLDQALFPALLQLATWPAERIRAGLSEQLRLTEKEGGRIVSDGSQDLLLISWEGTGLPYRRLRFEAPAAQLLIDARMLDEDTAQ